MIFFFLSLISVSRWSNGIFNIKPVNASIGFGDVTHLKLSTHLRALVNQGQEQQHSLKIILILHSLIQTSHQFHEGFVPLKAVESEL